MTRAGTTNALSRELVNPNPDWRRYALCRGRDTELWFDGDTTQGKAMCRVCPAKAECLEWAFVNGQDFGVWGGLDERERRELKRGHREMCRNGHELNSFTRIPSGGCRVCDDTAHEERMLAAGVPLAPCRCGRRISPRPDGYVPYHVDRHNGQRCPGTGQRAEVKA
jgi:WhiB family redox-sensing transcriptional regulator